MGNKTGVTEEARLMGDRIRAARERLEVTVTDLGYAYGGSKKSRQRAQFWEKGESFPPASELAKLCRLLGVDANYLLGFSPLERETRADVLSKRQLLMSIADKARNAEKGAASRKAPVKSARRGTA